MFGGAPSNKNTEGDWTNLLSVAFKMDRSDFALPAVLAGDCTRLDKPYGGGRQQHKVRVDRRGDDNRCQIYFIKQTKTSY